MREKPGLPAVPRLARILLREAETLFARNAAMPETEARKLADPAPEKVASPDPHRLAFLLRRAMATPAAPAETKPREG